MVVGVAGSMPVHGIGTACFIIRINGKTHILRIYNCLFYHGEDCYNLISVSQVLRTGQSEVVFSQNDARIRIREMSLLLKEHGTAPRWGGVSCLSIATSSWNKSWGGDVIWGMDGG